MLETKTLTSPTSRPSIRSVASTTLAWTALATSASFASESTVMKTSRWMDRSASTCTRTPRCAVWRRTQSPKWRAAASSIPETPSISHAARAAMLAMTSLATRTAPNVPLLPITWPCYALAPKIRSGLGPFHISLRASVDPDQVARLDEQGDLDHRAGLELGGLRSPGNGVTLEARI